MGRRRFLRSSLSSSRICLDVVASSLGCHALLTRFLRYTTAVTTLARRTAEGNIRTREARATILLRLQYIKECTGEARLLFCLNERVSQDLMGLVLENHTNFKSSSAWRLTSALILTVDCIRSRRIETSISGQCLEQWLVRKRSKSKAVDR